MDTNTLTISTEDSSLKNVGCLTMDLFSQLGQVFEECVRAQVKGECSAEVVHHVKMAMERLFAEHSEKVSVDPLTPEAVRERARRIRRARGKDPAPGDELHIPRKGKRARVLRSKCEGSDDELCIPRKGKRTRVLRLDEDSEEESDNDDAAVDAKQPTLRTKYTASLEMPSSDQDDSSDYVYEQDQDDSSDYVYEQDQDDSSDYIHYPDSKGTGRTVIQDGKGRNVRRSTRNCKHDQRVENESQADYADLKHDDEESTPEDTDEEEEPNQGDTLFFNQDGTRSEDVPPHEACYAMCRGIVVKRGTLVCIRYSEEGRDGEFHAPAIIDEFEDHASFSCRFFHTDHEMIELDTSEIIQSQEYPMVYTSIVQHLDHLDPKEAVEMMPEYRLALGSEQREQLHPKHQLGRKSWFDVYYQLVLKHVDEAYIWRTVLGDYIRNEMLKPCTTYGNLPRQDLVDKILDSDIKSLSPTKRLKGHCDACRSIRTLSETLEPLGLQVGCDCADRLNAIVNVRNLVHEFRNEPHFEDPNTFKLREQIQSYLPAPR